MNEESYRQTQRAEHERVCRELLPEVLHNALLNACLRQIADGVPTEGALLNAIRVLVARNDEDVRRAVVVGDRHRLERLLEEESFGVRPEFLASGLGRRHLVRSDIEAVLQKIEHDVESGMESEFAARWRYQKIKLLIGFVREYRANAERSAATASKAVRMLEGNQARALRALDEFERMNARGLPCGHTYGDLTYAPFSITKCVGQGGLPLSAELIRELLESAQRAGIDVLPTKTLDGTGFCLWEERAGRMHAPAEWFPPLESIPVVASPDRLRSTTEGSL